MLQKKFFSTVAVVVLALFVLSGCSSTMNAIKNKDLQVSCKMSDTIFLDAECLTGGPKVFVRVANTSDFQDMDFKEVIVQKLREMGYEVTPAAKDAQYHVAANILYMGQRKEGMDGDAILRAGFGGAVIGATVAGVSGSSLRGAGAAGLIAGAAVAGTEALVGSVFHVDEYLGVIDIQIMEEVEGGVKGTETANVMQGTSTAKEITRQITEKRQEYRTRIVASAKQTRMDRNEAVSVLSERLGAQISGLFKI